MNRVPFARRKIAALVLTFVIAGAVLFYVRVSVLVMQQANRDERRPVDAIVVFGAAEYSGRPSPVFKARLDHGLDLFRQDMAPFIITTGGSGGDLHYSEGGVGRDYLSHNGVPEASLIGETQGGDSAQSAERVAVIMRKNGMKTCLAVSDAYHLFRVTRMMQEEGMECYGSPRPGSIPHTAWTRFWAIQREASSYFLWKFHLT